MRSVHTKEIHINPDLPGLIYSSTPTGTILASNNQFAALLGLDNYKQVVCRTLSRYFCKTTLDTIEKNNAQALAQQTTQNFEEVWELNHNTQIQCTCTREPIFSPDGSCIAIITNAVIHSVNATKHKEEHTNFAKANFIANISHDLRTPLHTILGIAELLQIKKHYSEQEPLIQGIIESGQHLLHLVEQVLNYSEMENHPKKQPQLESFDLRQLIESLIQEHAHQIKHNNLELIISYCDSVPRIIKSNAQYIRRILSNLLTNSLKFTETGHILIAVEPVTVNEDNVTLQIAVEDTGVGIKPENLAHIFNRFYRAAPSYTSKYKGSGLGLAIAKQLTEHLGGQMNVNSQPNMGTTFSCTFTFERADQNIDPADSCNALSNANILIIDDHDKRRDTLLKQIPCQQKQAQNSSEAVDSFIANPNHLNYTLIIIDDEIKAMKPISLAKVIHSLCDQNQKPLLVLSTRTQNKVTLNRDSCFSQTLYKPLQPTDLSHRLTPSWKQWLDSQQRRHHQSLQQKLVVLLVEDEPLIQRFTKQILTEFGCEVDLAKNGQEALNKSLQPYHLILMDIGLPDMSGIEVTEKIRLSKDANRDTPIIAITAHASDQDRKRCLSSGVNEFLTKPASYSSFKKILQKYTH